MQPALLYEKGPENEVQCRLCNHFCQLGEGEAGICGVRQNRGGDLFSLNADRVAAMHPDPIEKKPLYHFLPATLSLSVAAMGCNFRCSFCQNYSLSQVSGTGEIRGETVAPEEIVNQALAAGADSISYTYSEPTVFFELMLETARLAREKGLKNVMVTNGYYSPQALRMITPFLDAANIDLKASSDSFYSRYCQARLKPVLQSIRKTREAGIWVEVTTLLIPGLNTGDVDAIIDFLLATDADVPWHVSRFYPQYRELDRRPTDGEEIIGVLQRAREKGLRYVYAGNMRDDRWENTWCPRCESLLIRRSGYATRVKGLKGDTCGKCRAPIAGVWS